jgi:hypothetical protein
VKKVSNSGFFLPHFSKNLLHYHPSKDATLFKAGLGGVTDSRLIDVLLSLGLSLDCVNAVLSRLNDKDLGGENLQEHTLTQLIQNIELYKNGGAIGGDRLLEGGCPLTNLFLLTNFLTSFFIHQRIETKETTAPS